MEIKDQKILITGGTGLLGSNIAHYLIEKRNVPPKKIRIFFLENTSTKALEDLPPLDMVPGDILNKQNLENACDGIELVFHTVGSTTFEPRAKKLQWFINVQGTQNIIDVLKNTKTFKRMVYTSTVNTLGCPNPKGSIGTIETSDPYINENKVHSFDSKREILNFADSINENRAPKKWWKKIKIGYHDSKLAAQELVNRTVEEMDLDIVSVLPGTFFGPYDVFIGPGVYLVQVYNSGLPGVLKTGFPLMHVEDVVRGHILAMEKGRKGEKYIITGKEEDNRYLKDMVNIIAETILEKEPDKKLRTKFITFPFFIAKLGAFFSELYSKLFKKPCILSKSTIKAASFPNFYSYEKAENDLGYTPEKTFKQGIEDLYDYYKTNNLLCEKQRKGDQIILEKASKEKK